MFAIHMGVPEMEKMWADLSEKIRSGSGNKEEVKLYKKLGKAFCLLARDPRHPGLETHEISSLPRRYGMKVWQSYLENHTPGAGRLFWVYGPEHGGITVIGLEPHPNDKSNSYEKITLSAMGEIIS